jgi:outer membrane protein TolC
MKKLLLIVLAALGMTPDAMALDMREVVELTLNNHQRIAQFQAAEEETVSGIDSARAAFYPRLDLNYAYTKRNNPPVQEEKEFSAFAINASYNLFNGLADLNGVRAAEARSAAAGYQLKAVLADLVLEARQAYIERLRAGRTVETSRESVALLERQYRDSRLYFQQGLIARNDLLRVEVELSSARQDLLQAKGDLRIAARRLERLTGTPIDDEQELEDFSQLPHPEEPDAETLRRQLLNQRSELHFLEQLVDAAGYDRSTVRGDYLPSVDLTLAHEEYGDSLSPVSGDFDHDQKVLLTASWTLFNGFATRQASAAADSRKRRLAAELRDIHAELWLQLQTALTDLEIARGQQREAQTGVSQAEENYRVTENRYRQQQATTFDLLDARFLLTRARNQEVNARYDLHNKAAVLDRVLERGTPH